MFLEKPSVMDISVVKHIQMFGIKVFQFLVNLEWQKLHTTPKLITILLRKFINLLAKLPYWIH